jgi:hypothetical protein
MKLRQPRGIVLLASWNYAAKGSGQAAEGY